MSGMVGPSERSRIGEIRRDDSDIPHRILHECNLIF